MPDHIITAQKSEEMLDYLLRRRSVPIKELTEPGPDATQINTILQAASRVPDHGRLFPWYFIVFEGTARMQIGEIIEKICKMQDPAMEGAQCLRERERFLRAPLVIGVISRIRKGKHPMWEQILSAGGACQNLCLAANALGFGTNWLTEWYSYDDTFCKELGLAPQDHIAGFIHIGTPKQAPTERDRPNLNEIVTYWKPGKPLNKGAVYGQPDQGWPKQGFDMKGIYNEEQE